MDLHISCTECLQEVMIYYRMSISVAWESLSWINNKPSLLVCYKMYTLQFGFISPFPSSPSLPITARPGEQLFNWKGFNLHVNEISFSYEEMGTKTRFEKKPKGNHGLLTHSVHFPFFQSKTMSMKKNVHCTLQQIDLSHDKKLIPYIANERDKIY